ncbi:MAG TPA: hypothetical protein VGD10_06525 [Allosphingosinicella sp.]|uniref:hypothetical protein n=1 Tax=Allosphingosinicella sp. TaxID=2823234 RepID=UPI002EDB0BB6
METFESVHLQLEVRGLARDVEVDGDLLKIFWSAFEGPQTAAELAEANRALFVRLIEDKIDRREVRADERELRLLSTDWTG